MPKCPNCGIDVDTKFCPECGTELKTVEETQNRSDETLSADDTEKNSFINKLLTFLIFVSFFVLYAVYIIHNMSTIVLLTYVISHHSEIPHELIDIITSPATIWISSIVFILCSGIYIIINPPHKIAQMLYETVVDCCEALVIAGIINYLLVEIMPLSDFINGIPIIKDISFLLKGISIQAYIISAVVAAILFGIKKLLEHNITKKKITE